MSSVVIALLASASVGAWVYSQMMRRTGGNTKSTLIITALAVGIAFVFVWSIASIIDSAVAKR